MWKNEGRNAIWPENNNLSVPDYETWKEIPTKSGLAFTRSGKKFQIVIRKIIKPFHRRNFFWSTTLAEKESESSQMSNMVLIGTINRMITGK